MYDRRLEAISAAAELGSFSRAAAKLRVSTPALVKQVSGFEAEFGITLFERSHSGVKVTPAGELLVDDARSIRRQSEDGLRRARRRLHLGYADHRRDLGQADVGHLMGLGSAPDH